MDVPTATETIAALDVMGLPDFNTEPVAFRLWKLARHVALARAGTVDVESELVGRTLAAAVETLKGAKK